LQKRKKLEILLGSIKRKKQLLEIRSKPLKDKEKHSDDFKKTFFRGIPFRSKPRNGLSRDIWKSAKGAFFSETKNENCEESIPLIFFGTEFRSHTAGKREKTAITRL
jgi:hypothetical protein